MKNVFLFCLCLVAMVNAGTYKFENIRKCSKIEDRLICSQNSYLEKGFVYLLNKKKLYVLNTNAWGNSFHLYTTAEYIVETDNNGKPIYTFSGIEDVESYFCYKKGFAVHHFLDKYGFDKKETIKNVDADFCGNKFNKLLP